MKLKSLKMLKLPVIVICMLAAGICYSCGTIKDSPEDGRILLNLETDHSDSQKMETVDMDASGTKTVDTDPQGIENVPGTEAVDKDSQVPARKDGNSTGQTAERLQAGVFVHVCGRVRNPGVYQLPQGSRVYEAIDAAGGFEEDGAVEYLNLAEEVQDGMKLEVPSESQVKQWTELGILPVQGAAQGQGTASGQGAKESKVSRVNINTASREELMSLRGIGESRAEDIIRYREKYGGFQSIEDIMNVSGIKDAAFEKIKDSITV